MIILGIDTSGYINAVGVIKDGKVLADNAPSHGDGVIVLADNRFPARTDTLEQIVDNIDVTLKQAGISLKDVDGIGVGLGPGSWTGIKVGVTVGKMLAFAAGKPVAGIPTLEALAYGAEDKSLPVYTVISAGVKDMVYAARYTFKGTEPVREGDYFAGDIRGLAELIKEPIILTGQNANYYRNILLQENEPAQDKAAPDSGGLAGRDLHNVVKSSINEPAQTGNTGDFGKKAIKALENEPAGAWVATLADRRFARNQGDNPLSLTPLYLKESTARVFINKYAGNK
jgi:tRNA threonylcarbamoyl adenosine modification protein YeaZ